MVDKDTYLQIKEIKFRVPFLSFILRTAFLSIYHIFKARIMYRTPRTRAASPGAAASPGPATTARAGRATTARRTTAVAPEPTATVAARPTRPPRRTASTPSTGTRRMTHGTRSRSQRRRSTRGGGNVFLFVQSLLPVADVKLEMPVFLQLLKSSILSSTSSQMDDTF